MNKGTLFFINYLIEKYITKKNVDILDVGVGDSMRYSLELSKKYYVNYYEGLEKNKKEYLKSKRNCVLYNNNINLLNINFLDYNKKKKFDFIIFFNSFHFIYPYEETFNKAKKLLNKNGVIIIREPLNIPYTWKTNFFNKDSKDFDENKWNEKTRLLNNAHNFLINKLEYHKFEDKNLFIFIN